MLWKSGSDDAFSALYTKYALKLLSVAVKKTNNRDDAQELVQNSFLKLYQRKENIEANTPVFPYLYVVLKNQVLNYHRSLLVRQKYETYVFANFVEDDNSLVENLESKNLEKDLENAVEQLPEKCQQVFIMSRKNNLSNKEIASALNISENTVEQHMRRALGKLRVSLKEYLVNYILLFLFIHLL
ncbi:RNA polymerase sigma factor [Pedobacter sp. V48]|uniref:RNA polymerase sigma factor n=1 Tax=Pedobacter sp. V48 TaxID=509635 RepID=UPI0003E546E4|nr:RNA polymerase sigma-70 factor [Pedobacter sp. V48]ETZ19213.1 hypothetical protein N824_10755 [Pedobacter sp. V48]